MAETGSDESAKSIDELKKLPLQQRIEKLKQLEEQAKKEIEEASRLLQQGREKERIEKITASVEVPEPKKIDITDLFKSGEKVLESIVEREAPATADETTVKYELQLDYKILTKIDTEMERYKLQKVVLKVEERVNELAARIDYSNISKDIADQLVATRSVLYSMKKRAGL